MDPSMKKSTADGEDEAHKRERRRRTSKTASAGATTTTATDVVPSQPLTVDNLRTHRDEAERAKRRDSKTTNTKSSGADAGTGGGGGHAAVPVGTQSASVDAVNDDDDETVSRAVLLSRVAALDRQLRIRNSDCARLLQERHSLLPLRAQCESQSEMIAALHDKVALLETQRESAMETVERLQQQMKHEEHQRRVGGFQQRLSSDSGNYGGGGKGCYDSSSPLRGRPTQGPATIAGGATATTPLAVNSKIRVTGITSGGTGGGRGGVPTTRVAPGGTIVNTRAGQQIIYDSSDISSVGFQKNARLPYDFLGGPGAQQQYQRSVQQQQQQQGGGKPNSNTNGNANSSGAIGSAGEQAEVGRVMDMAMEAAAMEVKYAEVEAAEEAALRARLEALKKK